MKKNINPMSQNVKNERYVTHVSKDLAKVPVF